MRYRAGPWIGYCPVIARQRQKILARRRTRYEAVVGPTEPSVQWIQGHLSSAVKMPGRKSDHLSLSTDEVKNEWIPTTTSPMLSWCVQEQLLSSVLYLWRCCFLFCVRSLLPSDWAWRFEMWGYTLFPIVNLRILELATYVVRISQAWIPVLTLPYSRVLKRAKVFWNDDSVPSCDIFSTKTFCRFTMGRTKMRLTFVLVSKVKPWLTARSRIVLHQRYTIISECNVRSCHSLNATLAQSKNIPFAVNTRTALKNTNTSDTNGI